MEALNRRLKQLPLRKALIATVSATVLLIALCSAVTVFGCLAVRNWLVPASNEVFLTIDESYPDGKHTTSTVRMTLGEDSTFPSLQTNDSSLPSLQAEEEDGGVVHEFRIVPTSMETIYRITRIDNSYSALSPKRQALYRGCEIAMVALPVLYSILGIPLCAFSFYRRKLLPPIQLLSDATDQISQQDLDFSLEYDSNDEMGRLCRSFETMRQALEANNRAMWEMLAQRRQLQASVAHDLRNPIAIIQGYTELLQLNLSTGSVEPERLQRVLSNIDSAAERLAQYTDSIRNLNQLEELEPTPKPVSLPQMLDSLAADLTMIAQQKQIIFTVTQQVPTEPVSLDRSMFYRILGNLFQNALRYAQHAITLDVAADGHTLIATLTDDGCGFPPQLLTGGERYLFTTEREGGHMGMGLTISRLLCQKQGGTLALSNPTEGGAQVELSLPI